MFNSLHLNARAQTVRIYNRFVWQESERRVISDQVSKVFFNAFFFSILVIQRPAPCPHRLLRFFNCKESNRTKIAGIPQLQFQSLAHVCQTWHGLTSYVTSDFFLFIKVSWHIGTFVAPVLCKNVVAESTAGFRLISIFCVNIDLLCVKLLSI